MRRNNKKIVFAILLFFVATTLVTFVYSGFSQTLNIEGEAQVKSAKWDIHFANLSAPQLNQTAQIITEATIKNPLSIGDYYVSFVTPGDTMIYLFDVVNDGNFDASISSLIKSEPQCTGNNSVSNLNVCEYLIYDLVYASTGNDYTVNESVAVSDMLYAGESRRLKLILKLSEYMPANKLPSNEVTISNLGITIYYIQSSGNQENTIVNINPNVETDISNFTFTISNNEVTITGYSDDGPKIVKIPSTIENLPVTSIGANAFKDKGLTFVEIPNTVTSIMNYAFSNNNLTSLTLPSNITTIKNYAFKDNKIVTLDIPNTLTSIGDYAFLNNQLISLNIPNTVTSIGASAFNNNQLLDNEAFIYARTDKNKDGIAEIDYTTVISYGGLNKDIIIPNTVTKIGKDAFSNNKLTSVVLPNNLKTIEMDAFRNNLLTSVDLPNTISNIPIRCFEGNRITSVEIPNSVTRISSSAFQHNLIESLTIPGNVKTVDNSSFSSNALTSLILESGLENIGSYAFYDSNLTRVIIPDTVTEIGGAAFSRNQISYLKLSSNLTSIGSSAFGSNALETVIIPSSVQSLYNSCFTGNNLKLIMIEGKNSSSEFDTYNPNWKWASDVTCVKNNTENVENGCITWGYNIDSCLVLSDTTITEYNCSYKIVDIPSQINNTTITAIGNSAFEQKGIISLTLPDTITSIGDRAFMKNNLTSIDLPSSLITIGSSAFQENKITSLVIPDSVTDIGSWSFRLNQIETLILGKRVNIIGATAFRYNKISSVEIPSSVNIIEQLIFDGNKLTSVIINGKSSSSEFSTYGNNPWGWDSNVTCVKNNTENVENGCITWNGN